MRTCSACKVALKSESSSPYLHWGYPNARFFESLEIQTCTECGFSSVNPEPNHAEINAFYESNYRAEGSPFFWNFAGNFPVPDQCPLRSATQIYSALHYIDWKPDEILLDIGAGPGDALYTATKMLDRPKLVVIEQNKGAKDYYKRCFGATSYNSLEDFSKTGQMVKLVILSHVLEHLPASALEKYLVKIRSVLVPNGAVVIEVPNDDFRRIRDFRFPDTPHLVFFSEQSLRLLLMKTGFTVRRTQVLGDERKPSCSRPPLIYDSKIQEASLRSGLKTILRKVGLMNLIRRYYRFKAGAAPDNHFKNFRNNMVLDCLRIVASPQ